jgi:hypothetical protein
MAVGMTEIAVDPGYLGKIIGTGSESTIRCRLADTPAMNLFITMVTQTFPTINTWRYHIEKYWIQFKCICYFYRDAIEIRAINEAKRVWPIMEKLKEAVGTKGSATHKNAAYIESIKVPENGKAPIISKGDETTESYGELVCEFWSALADGHTLAANEIAKQLKKEKLSPELATHLYVRALTLALADPSLGIYPVVDPTDMTIFRVGGADSEVLQYGSETMYYTDMVTGIKYYT